MLAKYPCGCSFHIVGTPNDTSTEYVNFGDDVRIDCNTKLISRDCQLAWDVYASGFTKGVFQLEKNLGQTWSRKLSPTTLEGVAALTALLRPGCLRAMSGEPPRSMTERYVDRARGNEQADSIHESIREALKETFQVLVYQEQAMKIAKDIASFNLQDADILRRACGKKKADVMAKVGKMFVEGCKKAGIVDEKIAEEIFGYIKESQRYSFNKCISKDSLIVLKDGTEKRISDVKVGDLIKAPGKYVKVLNVYQQGYQKVYEVMFGVYGVVCTINHKFLCSNNKVYPLWEILQNNYTVMCKDGHCYEIDQILDCGIRETMDLEVDSEEHLFYANGIATSNSHAMGYGKMSYWTAYGKAHWPLQFYASWLRGANWKGQDKYTELRELVNDAKMQDIPIKVPPFYDADGSILVRDKTVYFGLSEMKNIGPASIVKLLDAIKEAEAILDKPRKDFTWMDYLSHVADKVSSTVNETLILVGCFDYLGVPRSKLHFEYQTWSKITELEKMWIKNHKCNSLLNCIRACAPQRIKNKATGEYDSGGGTHTKIRGNFLTSLADMLENPPHSLEDSIDSISFNENAILGTPLSCFKIEGCLEATDANSTCKECLLGKTGFITIAVEILQIIPKTTKKGKNPGQRMASLIAADSTATMSDIVCFPGVWSANSNLLYAGNTVILQLEKTKTGSFSVQKVRQIG